MTGETQRNRLRKIEDSSGPLASFVTAAEVGEFVYCEEAWRLSRLSTPETLELSAGRDIHQRWNDAERSSALALKTAALVLLALALAVLVFR